MSKEYFFSEIRYVVLLVMSLTLATALWSVLSLQQYNSGNDVLAQGPTTNMSDTNATMPTGSLTLGDPIIEGSGMIIGQRVLEVHPVVKMETSFIQNDTILGNITTFEVGTYDTVMRPDGSLYGEGQGFFSTQDGQMGVWTGQGIGHFTEDGKTRFHGSLFFNTQSSGSLSFLNNLVGIFYYEVDKEGKTSATVWEWK
jgi:hypothetical protein